MLGAAGLLVPVWPTMNWAEYSIASGVLKEGRPGGVGERSGGGYCGWFGETAAGVCSAGQRGRGREVMALGLSAVSKETAFRCCWCIAGKGSVLLKGVVACCVRWAL